MNFSGPKAYHNQGRVTQRQQKLSQTYDSYVTLVKSK